MVWKTIKNTDTFWQYWIIWASLAGQFFEKIEIAQTLTNSSKYTLNSFQRKPNLSETDYQKELKRNKLLTSQRTKSMKDVMEKPLREQCLLKVQFYPRTLSVFQKVDANWVDVTK